MDLMEYKAKELFAAGGLPVQKFAHIGEDILARGDAELVRAAAGLSYPAVVKAQVMTGGRGKAGGIKFAANETELIKRTREIIGMEIKGHTVRSVMIAEKAEVVREFYLSVMLDRVTKGPVIIFSPLGGMEIEQVAKDSPEMIFKTPVHPLGGIETYHAAYLADKIRLVYPEFSAELQKELTALLQNLYTLFLKNDCLLCEVNPLALCRKDGAEHLLALDGKVSIDDSAVKRQPWLAEYAAAMPKHPLSREAESFGFLYIPCEEDGEIAVMSNGSGMLMSCIDLITKEGMRVRAVLDLGGGATAERIQEAVRIILSDERTKYLFINIFGGITRCDEVAGGIRRAYEAGHLTKPVILRFEGTNKARGLEIISGIPGVAYADSLLEGVAVLCAEKNGSKGGVRE